MYDPVLMAMVQRAMPDLMGGMKDVFVSNKKAKPDKVVVVRWDIWRTEMMKRCRNEIDAGPEIDFGMKLRQSLLDMMKELYENSERTKLMRDAEDYFWADQ